MELERPHVLIVGAGYVGMYTAFRLQRKLRGRARITVVEPQNHMTYQPFLPEAAAGAIEPRHVAVPLRRVLKGCRMITGVVRSVSHSRRVAEIVTPEGAAYDVDYDMLVMGVGSVARTLPIPGLAEHGIGFNHLGEAIYLRNHVLSRLDLASSTQDPTLRRRALTFVFVGGGYAGLEAMAELEDMARYALRYYDGIKPEDMRWVLVEATGRILPEVSLSLAESVVEQLRRRGMDVRLNTRVNSMSELHVVLSDGEEFDTETVVWTAGVKPNPMLADTDLPLDEKGRVIVDAELRVRECEGAWSAGDCAAVPDLTKDDPGALTAPTAQHAVRQAKTLADNIVRTLRGGRPKPYRHAYVGSVASLGVGKGVAEIKGVKVKGLPAWVMHRSYHVLKMPTVNRRVRILSDWTLGLFFPREVVSLGQLQEPRADFEAASRPADRKLPTGT